jgi:hypothetical protein
MNLYNLWKKSDDKLEPDVKFGCSAANIVVSNCVTAVRLSDIAGYNNNNNNNNNNNICTTQFAKP